MRLQRQFTKFLENMSLNDTREAQARAAHESLQSYLADDRPTSQFLFETFLQGSYEHGTIIRPTSDGVGFDVDVVIGLHVHGMPAERQHPHALVDWLRGRLVASDKYRGKVRQRNRCIRITFSNLFHLDVVAAAGDTRTGQAAWVPDRDLGQWVKSHPKKYTSWIESVNGGLKRFQFKRVVKMLKCWRNEKLGADTAPRSIVLQTLLGHYVPALGDYDGENLVASLIGLEKGLEQFKSVPKVPNPAITEENLAREWSDVGFLRFKERVRSAREKAEVALASRFEDVSTRYWKELLGERFPAS